MGAADSEQPRDAGFERRRHHGRHRPRADRDDVGDAGHAGRNGRHQQRRRERKPAAGHVAPHARERLDALIDHDTGCDPRAPALGQLSPRHARDVARGGRDGPPHVGRDVRRLCVHLGRRDLERRLDPIEPAREAGQRPIARLAHAIDDPADAAIERAVGAHGAREEALQRGTIGRVDDSEGGHVLPFQPVPPIPPFPPIPPRSQSCSAGTPQFPVRVRL